MDTARTLAYLINNPDKNLRRYEILTVLVKIAEGMGGWTPTERELHRTFNEQCKTFKFKEMGYSTFRDHMKTLIEEGLIFKVGIFITIPRAKWKPPKQLPTVGSLAAACHGYLNQTPKQESMPPRNRAARNRV